MIVRVSMLLGATAVLLGPLAIRADEPTPSGDAAAIAAIEKIGGSVRRARGLPGKREVAFHVRGRKLIDEDLVHVAALDGVVSLNLRDTRITDDGLEHVARLKDLRRLHLERTAIGDAGIGRLAGLTELEYLNVYGTRITNAALAHLDRLKKLRRLYVWRTGVTEAGAAELENKLPGLKVVLGVDLSKVRDYEEEEELEAPKPTEDLEWLPVSDARDVPKSQNGINTQVFFENKSGHPVKLYWKSYGGELKHYADLAPGAVRQQNSYSRNTWMITDAGDRPLGYFVVGTEVSRAVIPAIEIEKGT